MNRIANFMIAAVLGAALVPVSASTTVLAADEAQERCDDKHNKCTTRAEAALETCKSACKDSASADCKGCDDEHAQQSKVCDDDLAACSAK